MDLKENTDIIAIKFLSENNEVKITKDWLLKLKNISKKDIDNEAYKLLLDDLENDNLKFQISLQEHNYIKSCKKENILEYLLYRYKFKEFPRRKISSDFPVYILIEPVSSCNLKCGVCFQSDKSFIKKNLWERWILNYIKK